jgi:hypothetical protein
MEKQSFEDKLKGLVLGNKNDTDAKVNTDAEKNKQNRVTISGIDVPFVDILFFVFKATMASLIVSGSLLLIYWIIRYQL